MSGWAWPEPGKGELEDPQEPGLGGKEIRNFPSWIPAPPNVHPPQGCKKAQCWSEMTCFRDPHSQVNMRFQPEVASVDK